MTNSYKCPSCGYDYGPVYPEFGLIAGHIATDHEESD